MPNATSAIAGLSPVIDPFSTVQSVNNNLVNPQTYEWNLGFEHQLPANLKWTVSYVGVRGEKLFANQQFNFFDSNTGDRLNPDRGVINTRGNYADSILSRCHHGCLSRLQPRPLRPRNVYVQQGDGRRIGGLHDLQSGLRPMQPTLRREDAPANGAGLPRIIVTTSAFNMSMNCPVITASASFRSSPRIGRSPEIRFCSQDLPALLAAWALIPMATAVRQTIGLA